MVVAVAKKISVIASDCCSLILLVSIFLSYFIAQKEKPFLSLSSLEASQIIQKFPRITIQVLAGLATHLKYNDPVYLKSELSRGAVFISK